MLNMKSEMRKNQKKHNNQARKIFQKFLESQESQGFSESREFPGKFYENLPFPGMFKIWEKGKPYSG